MLKRLMAMVIATVFVFTSLQISSEAAPEIKVKVDGNYVQFPDARPFIDSANRTLIPIRFVSEALGAQVDWNAQYQAVGVKKGDTKLILYIGSNEIQVENSTNLKMDTSAQIHQSRTYVPLRFVSEALGAKVAWEASTYTVVITTDGSEPQVSNTGKVYKYGYEVNPERPWEAVGVTRFDKPTPLVIPNEYSFFLNHNSIKPYIYLLVYYLSEGTYEKEFDAYEFNRRGMVTPKQYALIMSSEVPDHLWHLNTPEEYKKMREYSDYLEIMEDYKKNETYLAIETYRKYMKDIIQVWKTLDFENYDHPYLVEKFMPENRWVACDYGYTLMLKDGKVYARNNAYYRNNKVILELPMI